MNKMYLMIKPSEFWKYGSVDIEGKYPHTDIEDFDIDPKFNYLFFELGYKKDKDGNIKYSKTSNLLLADGVEGIFDINYDTENNTVELSSDYLGLYMKAPVNVEDVKTIPSKVAGLMNALMEDKDLLAIYMSNFESLLDSSKFYKECYDETIDGPSNSLLKSIKKAFRQTE